MGAASTVLSAHNGRETDRDNDSQEVSFIEWKVFPSQSEAIKRFIADGTLKRNHDTDQLELRALLEEPISQQALGIYAKKVDATDYLACWCDIQEFKQISADSYRRSTALAIYEKYLESSSATYLNLCSSLERNNVKKVLTTSEKDPRKLGNKYFNGIQYLCFTVMVEKIYKPFKQTEEFDALNETLKHKYNNVRLTHFKYFSKVGEGGFGFVVKCRKISTGKFYAMKIQPKSTLLKHSKIAPYKVTMERNTMVACRHPFIVSLEYAFQTEALAMLVVELSLVDLHHYQIFSPGGYLKELHVRFYAAEIVLALAYLHQMGLIYRDLKPHNILLHEDGHIRLIDLGCVMDVKGRYINSTSDAFRAVAEEQVAGGAGGGGGGGYQQRAGNRVAVLAESFHALQDDDDDSPYSMSRLLSLERSHSRSSGLDQSTSHSSIIYENEAYECDLRPVVGKSNRSDIGPAPPSGAISRKSPPVTPHKANDTGGGRVEDMSELEGGGGGCADQDANDCEVRAVSAKALSAAVMARSLSRSEGGADQKPSQQQSPAGLSHRSAGGLSHRTAGARSGAGGGSGTGSGTGSGAGSGAGAGRVHDEPRDGGEEVHLLVDDIVQEAAGSSSVHDAAAVAAASAAARSGAAAAAGPAPSEKKKMSVMGTLG